MPRLGIEPGDLVAGAVEPGLRGIIVHVTALDAMIFWFNPRHGARRDVTYTREQVIERRHAYLRLEFEARNR